MFTFDVNMFEVTSHY